LSYTRLKGSKGNTGPVRQRFWLSFMVGATGFEYSPYYNNSLFSGCPENPLFFCYSVANVIEDSCFGLPDLLGVGRNRVR